MKKLFILWLGLVSIITASNAQQQIQTKALTISYNKTTSLIFPFSITSVDRGSKDVIAQKARDVENVLQVKASRRDFAETNLTVITADGMLHQFAVTYSDTPSTQAITVATTDAPSMILVKDAVNERIVQSYARAALIQKVNGIVHQQKRDQLIFTLEEIFIHDGIMYYRIHIRNKSSINYDIKSLKLFIRDKKKVKRTSSQEVEITPVFVGNDVGKINGYASATMVYAVKKFTIPNGKILQINLFEDNGGRNLSLRVDNKDILKARMLSVSNKHLFTIN
jgi:conjugative transposon TraN protein